jgi:hypothetical protein
MVRVFHVDSVVRGQYLDALTAAICTIQKYGGEELCASRYSRLAWLAETTKEDVSLAIRRGQNVLLVDHETKCHRDGAVVILIKKVSIRTGSAGFKGGFDRLGGAAKGRNKRPMGSYHLCQMLNSLASQMPMNANNGLEIGSSTSRRVPFPEHCQT